MKRRALFLPLVTVAFSAGIGLTAAGADVTITSTYDEATGQWIGDVDALTNALNQSTSARTVWLAAGVYDVTALTNAMMYSETYYGKALLRSRKAKIKSLSGNPADVIIQADPAAGARILTLETGGELHGVTLTGGNASSKYIAYFNHRVAGAVLLLQTSSVISNCVFHGNQAAASGGAVGAPYGYYDKGVVYDSVFRGNNDSSGQALVASRTILHRCVITNNVSGGIEKQRDISVTTTCKIYDSYIADNKATTCGGARGGCAVDCTFVNNVQNNPLGNHWSDSGGGAARDAALTNCVFYGNVAYRFGGAVRGGTVHGCEIVSNRTIYSASREACGGGVYGATSVTDSTVASNYCAGVGGGLHSCGSVTDTSILFNCAAEGGGAYGSALVGCDVFSNVASVYGASSDGGAGGGLRGGSAVDCVFADNSSTSYASELLKGCTISGSLIHAKNIESCVIHSVSNGPALWARGNVRYPDGFSSQNMYMLMVSGTMRNCLVTNCNWRSLDGSFANTAVFTPYGPGTARVENCTFADNGYYLLARFFTSDDSGRARAIAFVNSAFVRNRPSLASTTPKDIETFSCPQLVFSNCVYGVVTSLTAREDGYADSACVELGTSGKPRFVTDGSAPDYTPSFSSPLRKAGLLLDWMTETAVDLAGNPRVRDGKVDVGCYQCWLNPVSTCLIVR